MMLTGFSIMALLAYSNAQSGVETYSSINPPSPIACSYANNSLGQCRCNGQLWIAHQCHSGFFCLGAEDEVIVDMNGDPLPNNARGCEIECADDEILVVDPHNGGGWECHKTNENTRPLICPGKFMTECACTPEESPDEPEECQIGECGCDNQVWVAHDCHEAKICYPDRDPELVNCLRDSPDTPFVNVNLITHEWFCSADGDNCLGSFHVGCRADIMPSTATSPTDNGSTSSDDNGSTSSDNGSTSSDDNGSTSSDDAGTTPGGGAPNIYSSLLVLALPIVATKAYSVIMI